MMEGNNCTSESLEIQKTRVFAQFVFLSELVFVTISTSVNELFACIQDFVSRAPEVRE